METSPAPSALPPWLCRVEHQALLMEVAQRAELSLPGGSAARIVVAKLAACDVVVKFSAAQQAFVSFLPLVATDLRERTLWTQRAREVYGALVKVGGARGVLAVSLESLSLEQSEDAADLLAFVHMLATGSTEDKRAQVIVFPPSVGRADALAATLASISKAEKIREEAAAYHESLLKQHWMISDIQALLQERGRERK